MSKNAVKITSGFIAYAVYVILMNLFGFGSSTIGYIIGLFISYLIGNLFQEFLPSKENDNIEEEVKDIQDKELVLKDISEVSVDNQTKLGTEFIPWSEANFGLKSHRVIVFTIALFALVGLILGYTAKGG